MRIKPCFKGETHILMSEARKKTRPCVLIKMRVLLCTYRRIQVHVCVHLLCSHLPACVLFARTPSKRGLWFVLHVLLWGENKQRLAGTRLPTPPCVPGPLRHIEFPLFSHSAVMYIHLHTRLVCVLVCAVSALCSNAPPPLPQKLLVCVCVWVDVLVWCGLCVCCLF